MKLYVLRHGETDANKNRIVQSYTDYYLNKDGVNDALRVKKELENISFDKIFSSPLKRAKQTAEIICENSNILYDDLLVERNFGDLENKKMPEGEELKKLWNFSYNENNVETVYEILDRSKEFLNKIKKENVNNILVVSHGAFLQALHFNIVGYDKNTNLSDYKISNCEIKVYDI